MGAQRLYNFQTHKPVQTKIGFAELPFDEPEPEIKPLYKKEIAKIYGISLPTLRAWIRPFMAEFEAIGYYKSIRIFTPNMVKLVYDKIGRP